MHLLVFDSGIGGLGVVREIRALQPGAHLTYLADNACFPYGEQEDDFLTTHIIDLIGGGIEKLRPDAAVIACNTASTIALPALRETFAIPFIGCVPPIKPAAAATKSGHVGLLATPATIRRPYLQNLINLYAAGCTIHSLGTPTLAALAEQKFAGATINLASLAAAIAPLFAQQNAALIDTIALGCTHYTFLLPELQTLHPEIAFFDPALPVARRTLAITQMLPASLGPQPDIAYFTAPPLGQPGMTSRLAAFGFSQINMLSPGKTCS